MLPTLDEATEASWSQSGWEKCYHRQGTLHINVKVHTDHQALWAKVHELEAKLHVPEDEIWRILDTVSQRELENWWDDLHNGNVEYLLSEDVRNTDLFDKDYWADGRMGGWLHVSESWRLRNPELVELLGEHCQNSVKYFNSTDYVNQLGWLVEETLEADETAGKERCPTCRKIR